jgi:hypothetical protein
VDELDAAGALADAVLDRAIVLDREVEVTTFCTDDCTLVVAPFSAVLRSLLSLLRGEVLPRLESGSASSTAIAANAATTDAAVARFRPFDHPVIKASPYVVCVPRTRRILPPAQGPCDSWMSDTVGF